MKHKLNNEGSIKSNVLALTMRLNMTPMNVHTKNEVMFITKMAMELRLPLKLNT